MKATEFVAGLGDIILEKVVVNFGTSGEIELTDTDPQLEQGSIVSFHADAKVGKSRIDYTRQVAGVILTIDRSSFVIDSVEMPPEPPATEPMLGPDGEVLIGDVVDAAVDALVAAGVDAKRVSDPAAELDAATHHPFKKGSPDPAMCKVCGEAKDATAHENPRKATVLRPEAEGGED